MSKLKLYLDMCCFNRPYDDQMQPRIQFESEAKLMIQSLIVNATFDYAWSYVLEFENSNNPFKEKRVAILAFKQYSCEIIEPCQKIEDIAEDFQKTGLKAYDSLHLASAIYAGCDYFLTTDNKVLKKKSDNIIITDPVTFINQWLRGGITQ